MSNLEPLRALLLAGNVDITYEEQAETRKTGHRNGLHKYKTYFQADSIISRTAGQSTAQIQPRFSPKYWL